MMKLTVAFLGALAAADAAEARTHRQARRQYGYGNGYGNGYGGGGYGASVSSAKPVETPMASSVAVPVSSAVVSSAVAYSSGTAVEKGSSVPVEASSLPPKGGDYGHGYGYGHPVPSSAPGVSHTGPAVPSGGKPTTPAVPASSGTAVEKGSSVPVEASSLPPKGGDYGYGHPVPSFAPGVSHTGPAVPSGGKPTTPAGVVPSSPAVPSGAKPSSSVVVNPSGGNGFPGHSASGKIPSNSGVFPSSAVLPSGTGAVFYPSGTGVPKSATPLTDMVTKTIYSTQIYHVSSKLSTTVVAVGTTVCPKDEASKTPGGPFQPSPTPGKVITSEVPVSEVTKTFTETLVYTVGIGSTAHPVTTEVVSTSTSTVYKTVVVTLAKETPGVGQQTPSVSQQTGASGYYQGTPEEQTSTQTVRSTATTTNFITVRPTPSGYGNGNVSVGDKGSPVPQVPDSGKATGPAGGAGATCAPPATVTVTSKETIYVTAGQAVPSYTPGSGIPPQPQQPQKPSGGAGVPGKPAATPSAPFPVNNGTSPCPAGPTGFKTSTKSAVPVGTAPVGTGIPSKPSSPASSSLPAFSFVSAAPSKPVASSAPDDTKTPDASVKPSATPSAAPPAGGDYGSGYGQAPAPASSPKAAETQVPSNEKYTSVAKASPTPTPAGGNGYGSGYGTY